MTAGLLVQYGRPGYVGRFRAGADAARGERVVVRGPRGLELGTVLCAPVVALDEVGEVVRAATPADDAAADRADALARDFLDAADELAVGLPVAFPDAEAALDSASAVLHALPWAACDLDPILVALSDRFGLLVRLLDLSRTPVSADPPDPATATCGKPDCGTGGGCSSCGTGGGCSTGSCSRGAVKSAAELTSYFADLRGKMEAAGRTPLV